MCTPCAMVPCNSICSALMMLLMLKSTTGRWCVFCCRHDYRSCATLFIMQRGNRQPMRMTHLPTSTTVRQCVVSAADTTAATDAATSSVMALMLACTAAASTPHKIVPSSRSSSGTMLRTPGATTRSGNICRKPHNAAYTLTHRCGMRCAQDCPGHWHAWLMCFLYCCCCTDADCTAAALLL